MAARSTLFGAGALTPPGSLLGAVLLPPAGFIARRGSSDPAGVPDRRSPYLAIRPDRRSRSLIAGHGSNAHAHPERTPNEGDLRSGTRAGSGDPRTANAQQKSRAAAGTQ